MPLNIPELDIDPGIITHGSCDTPESQVRFDAEQMGKPPAIEE